MIYGLTDEDLQRIDKKAVAELIENLEYNLRRNVGIVEKEKITKEIKELKTLL